jgi:hypothetical protein
MITRPLRSAAAFSGHGTGLATSALIALCPAVFPALIDGLPLTAQAGFVQPHDAVRAAGKAALTGSENH